MMLIRQLHALIAALYRTELPLDIEDFLVTNSQQLATLDKSDNPRPTTEKLLISQSDDAVDLALYLDDKLLQRLHRHDPFDRLSEKNFADFCVAIEGVSHFNYVAWNAAADKAVTLLELEMQAEVDKYVAARALLHQQRHMAWSAAVYDRLFLAFTLDPAVSAVEACRYRDASTIAGQYCRTLERRYPADHIAADMAEDFRTFYRLPQPDKLSHIQTRSY